MFRLRTALYAYLAFLQELGLAGEADGVNLRLPRAALDLLAGNLTKKPGTAIRSLRWDAAVWLFPAKTR
jgi:hypothetical protein